MLDETDVVVVRPLISKLLTRYWISALCMGLPPVITLYVFSLAAGEWAYVLLLHVIPTAIGFVLTMSLRRSRVVLSPEGITETDLFTAPVSTPRAEMSSILMVPVTDGNSSTAHNHLFLFDHDGRTRLRMRGAFWGEEALENVVRSFDLPVVRVEKVATMSDLRAEYGSAIYWRERHPYLLGVVIGIGIVVLTGPVLWMVDSFL
ncbi:hypothetical protein [Naasia lichenicola]|uniref:PH domain-containing protein n=1 Tax=Naasia lichenicola TaxID=2565933 RepID=A0A4S4FIX5_9MICO|nr:hypothetical protein [Naasia lichenicola]THG30051.1 hypothetical protein E6C64_15550 [Naasia lichenicola]